MLSPFSNILLLQIVNGIWKFLTSYKTNKQTKNNKQTSPRNPLRSFSLMWSLGTGLSLSLSISSCMCTSVSFPGSSLWPGRRLGMKHNREIHCTRIRPDNVPTSYWHILPCLTLFTLPLLPFLVAIATARSFASGSPHVKAVIATPADYSDRQRDIVR